MKIPTEHDLTESIKPYCLDTEWMLKNFLGKDQKEAIELIKTSNVSEDFAYMQLKGLRYYLEAALMYLKSEQSENDEFDFPTGLLTSLDSQINILEIDKSIYPLIEEVTNYCDENREKFLIEPNDKFYNSRIKSIRKSITI